MDQRRQLVNNVVAAGPGATADFSQLSLISPVTVTLDGDQTIGNLLFDDQSGGQNSWTLDTGTGGLLTLAVTSGTPVISNNVPTTISAAIAGTQAYHDRYGELTFTGQRYLQRWSNRQRRLFGDAASGG